MKLCKNIIFCTFNRCAEERFCGKYSIVQNDFVVQCSSKQLTLLEKTDNLFEIVTFLLNV